MSGSDATQPSLEDKVRFLGQRAWPGEDVEAIETHMSWVFLTGDRAYKLKKPVLQPYLDYRTLEARRADCAAELELNQYLAPGVYLGLERLTTTADGDLRVGGAGPTVEWLVVMRRLDRSLLLDQRIAAGSAVPAELDPVLELLDAFYRRAPRLPTRPTGYRRQLASQARHDLRELSDRHHRLDAHLVHRVGNDLLERIARCPDLDPRASMLVDGHGDLRPEHVRPGPPPLVIDRISFDRRLRRIDPYFDLALLAVECEQADAHGLARHVLHGYRARADDPVPDEILELYQALRATTRARLAIAHLHDPGQDRMQWTKRCEGYLSIAAAHIARTTSTEG